MRRETRKNKEPNPMYLIVAGVLGVVLSGLISNLIGFSFSPIVFGVVFIPFALSVMIPVGRMK